jgi:methyltransferase-like protein
MELECLFSSLRTESKNAKIDRDALKKNVKKLDIKGQELIFGIIVTFSVNTSENPDGFPYGGKRNKSGNIRFDLNSLPDELIKILTVFAKKHLNKMKEDELREDVGYIEAST